MKLRMSRDLYAAVRARADLLGCDVSEVARRCLRASARVADTRVPQVATPRGSVVATLDLDGLPGDRPAARIAWALDATATGATAAKPELECEPDGVVVMEACE